MSNFVPHETKRILPPWISMLNRKNRLFKSYKRHSYKPEHKIRLNNFRRECREAIETAKLSYFTNIGNKPNDRSTSQKSFWKIINNVINNCKTPKIPPLLVSNLFVINCREKVKLFTECFRGNVTQILTISFSPTSVT